jgi:hypothetical protein
VGDPSGKAVQIAPEGWSVVDRLGVHFRRPERLLALPTPSRGRLIALLRPYVNLSYRDFRLVIVRMAAALRPVGPYPVLTRAAPAHWPKSAGWLTNELRRIAPQLRMHGIPVAFERNRDTRLIALTSTNPPDGRVLITAFQDRSPLGEKRRPRATPWAR